MLVLIDESGDPGFKLVRGSSSHFVVAMVIFNDLKEAERAGRSIADARSRLRVHPEFKFTKSHDRVRDECFAVACGFRFKVRALVIDKARLYSANLRENTDRFYSYFVQLLIRNDNGVLHEASIKIDGSGDREFKRQLNAYLRRQLPQGQMRKLRFVDSDTDNLVQLADMCAGAILRAYRSDTKRNDRWLAMLRRSCLIDDLWEFP